jgi:cytochrome bd-type quinol oxidase subunit 2
MDTDVIPADKALRKKVILFLIIVVLTSLVLEPHFKAYMDQLSQLSKEDPDLALEKTMLLLKWSLRVVFVALVGMGAYLILLARRTLRSDQYPPPGMRVIRDTRLRTGNQAKKAAISLIVLAALFIAVAFFFLCWPYAFEKTLLKKTSSGEKMDIFMKRGGDME